jgi:formylglycine-generating enzyme required for sulfatase activity
VVTDTVTVFVSYASTDRDFAQRLVTDLQTAGAEVWWDVKEIDEGDFLQRINAALQHCRWFVLVLTPHAIASEWVNIEVNAAIHRRKQGFMDGVLPVLATPVQAGTIPPVWDNLHRYDAVRNYQAEVGRLLSTLGLSLAPVQEPAPQAPVQPAPPTHNAPPDRFPPRLAELGFRVDFLNGAEVILPPLCDVPAGPFLMGSDPHKDKAADKSERPQQWVTLGAFAIGAYPVTVAEYAGFVRSGYAEPNMLLSIGWKKQLVERLDHPVVNIKWQDAVAYAAWMAQQTGQPWRLPTEAEWEKAARWDAATGSARIYPWGDTFYASRANIAESNTGKTTPIGSYPAGASPYGALDMAGNVWEWTSSLYTPYPYNASDGRERLDAKTNRVMRGASWGNVRVEARAALRLNGVPGRGLDADGFRLARSISNS